MTPASGASTPVALGTGITLTATVQAGSTAIKVGQVQFCDATSPYCLDIHLLGTAQLTGAGTATLTLVPTAGAHSYKATFVGTPSGTPAYAASTSPTESLTVNGAPSTTTITSSGSAGNYTLTAQVTGSGSIVSPSGSVSFLDTSNGNSSLGLAALGVATLKLGFLNASMPRTGTDSAYIEVSDFNGDGIADIAAVNVGDETVSILLSNGDGTFSPATNSPAAAVGAGAIAEGDYNGDGFADLAVANVPGGSVTILLGAGNGMFTPSAQSPAAGAGPRAIATGDFNQDGIADLAIANGDDKLTILIGKGDGTFVQVSSRPAVGALPTSIAVGDFNSDSIEDLAVLNERDGTVTILLGNGDGTFAQAPDIPVTGSALPTFVAAADFNGDGVPDLAVADGGLSTVTVLLGKADGTFTNAPGSPVAVGDGPEGLAVGDFNGDGIADIATANEDDGTSTILLGNGDGTFTQTAPDPIIGGNASAVAVGAFTTNGTPDLVGAAGDFAVSILLSQLTQTATATASGISPTGTGTHQIQASYPGDATYKAGSSGTVGLTAVPAPGISISGAAVSVAAGATSGNTSAISVASINAFAGTVTLAATITASPANAINPPTLSFGSTGLVSVSASTAGAAVLTISTTAPTSGSCTSSNTPQRSAGPWYFGGGAALASVFCLGLAFRRRRWQSLLGMALLLIALGGSVTACGGGSKSTVCPQAIVAGTTSGSYTITVTGTAGAVTGTSTINLTVQ